MATDGKPHMSVVICGHVDSGKSTTTGHLLFELGGIGEREMVKLREEADRLGKSSFAFAFYMDRQKEERERGVTISVTTKEFFTDKFHYTVIDAPGHRDFIKNMISGASQADVAMIMIPADGNFTTAIQKGDHKAGEIQGQSRQHARLIHLLGVKQVILGINKMDTESSSGTYSEARFTEIKDEAQLMLTKVGWAKDFVNGGIPVVPISGWRGDNLIAKSTNMAWYKGQEKTMPISGEKRTGHTLKDWFDNKDLPPRVTDKPMRMPVSGVYKIKGVGDVITGRVEQGQVNTNKDVFFVPTHTAANKCAGKVFNIEMHHKNVTVADPGDNVGLNVKNLNKENMVQAGDVMIYKEDTSLSAVTWFQAIVKVLDVPGEKKVGYSPICFVRTARAATQITQICEKKNKQTGKEGEKNPTFVKSNDQCTIIMEPRSPLVCDSFKNCEGLSRVAFLDGNSAVMLGKVVATSMCPGNVEYTVAVAKKKAKA